MSTIPVAEIFGVTIQGEGPNIGQRCIFVRVHGCSFHCSWCDSKHTWAGVSSDFEQFEEKDLAEEISRLCREKHCNRVVLTGGNPCMYDFTKTLAALNASIHVDVETQGDVLPHWLIYADTIVFSPKGPSSGMKDTYSSITHYIEDERNLAQKVAIKIPIFNSEDIEFARKYARWVNSYNDSHDYTTEVRLYLSVGNSDTATTESIRDRVLSDYENLLCAINESPEDFENVFILPQLHTLVWGNRQGV